MTEKMNSIHPCIDIGANLTNARFRSDLPQLLRNASSVGVEKIIVTGTSLECSQHASELCERHPHYLSCTAGIHPHDAKSFDPASTSNALRELLRKPQVVAVGECGLDFNRDFSPRDAQRECFVAQLELSSKTQLPLFLHERDAFDEFHSIMEAKRNQISRGVVHCFTGNEQALRAYLELDLHIGITGWICDEQRGKHLQELVTLIPADRLMIETDCPYLAPKDHRPRIKRNEPKYLPHILRRVAEFRGEDASELSTKLIDTTNKFFSFGREAESSTYAKPPKVTSDRGRI